MNTVPKFLYLYIFYILNYTYLHKEIFFCSFKQDNLLLSLDRNPPEYVCVCAKPYRTGGGWLSQIFNYYCIVLLGL